MKKSFSLSQKPAIKQKSSSVTANQETLFLKISKQNKVPIESIDIFRGAGAIVPLLKSCFIGRKNASKNYYVRAIDDNCVAINFMLDDFENMTGFSCTQEIFNDICERLGTLHRFCGMPSSQFRHAEWISAQPVSGIERTARSYKLVSALQRFHCDLYLNDTPLVFPDVRFQTTRILTDERQTFGRPIDLKLDQKAGQIQIPIGQKRNRNVQFRCINSAVFSEIVTSLQQGKFVFRPVIDLISTEQDQLHSIEILDMSPCQMNANLDFQKNMQ